jgi:hypothetical protein
MQAIRQLVISYSGFLPYSQHGYEKIPKNFGLCMVKKKNSKSRIVLYDAFGARADASAVVGGSVAGVFSLSDHGGNNGVDEGLRLRRLWKR